MLCYASGYALANKGHDTRAIQGRLGQRSITSTALYTAPAANRFKDFWRIEECASRGLFGSRVARGAAKVGGARNLAGVVEYVPQGNVLVVPKKPTVHSLPPHLAHLHLGQKAGRDASRGSVAAGL
jgi:hypothetical protein